MVLTQNALRDPFWDPQDRPADDHAGGVRRLERSLSPFEKLISTHPPILESLLLQLPTPALFHLYHTSNYLRSFLQSYPTAWSYLSFRLPATSVASAQGSPGSENSPDQRPSKPYALDQLLLMVVTPFGTRLRTLDLDNSAVSGYVLTSAVLPQRRETLEHLSVRGCKSVSLKYHVVPYLTVFGLQRKASGVPKQLQRRSELALKSIYTYRCRHHRRRPYFPQSLLRRDSDSDPTHELIKICHELGIWTDTAWCPTPGGRCLRRKEYHIGRSPSSPREAWVVFDRLWRSGNRFGSSEESSAVLLQHDGRLWEQKEWGHNGEALGTGEDYRIGEGKTKAAHLRESHRRFVEGFKCDQCRDPIAERCEQCSVRMHCLGCRKTLCASCAFDQPLPKKRRKNQQASIDQNEGERGASQPAKHEFWWAPGAYQSPNLMQEGSEDEQNPADNNNVTVIDHRAPRKLKFQWCCLEPIFSGGGGIAFVGPGMSGPGAGRIRTAPLPRGHGWEDPEFVPSMAETFPASAYGNIATPDYTSADGNNTMLRWFLRGPEELHASSCPRNLCQECYNTMGWQAACQACKKPLCLEHDLRGLKMRICGYRDLTIEKAALREPLQAQETSTEPEPPSDTGNPKVTGRQAIEIARNYLKVLNDPQRSQELASLIVLHNADDSDLPDASGNDNRSIATSSSTPEDDNRSGQSSKTGSRSSSQQPHSINSPKSVRIQQWQGCASFFCQQFRSIGDHRNRCTGLLKECGTCGVHVCQDCLVTNPPCTCTYCSERYNCPNCYRKLDLGVCRKAIEERERQRKAKEAELVRLTRILSRKLADEIAGQLGDFFAGLEMFGVENDESGDVEPL